jgi:hypothetical protein
LRAELAVLPATLGRPVREVGQRAAYLVEAGGFDIR